MKLVIPILIAFIPLLLTGQQDDRGYIVRIGDPVPEFEMKLTSGEKINIKDLKGKIVMLQFTASWCGVCRKEMPFIENDIWLKLKTNPEFALFGIDRDEPLDKVIWFGEKVGITYPMGLDPGAEIFQLFALPEAGVTRNVIINREGEIVYLTRLFNKEEFDAMKAVIFELLEE